MHNKVVAGGAAGALSILVVWVAGLFGLEVPAEVASALTTLFAVGGGYLKSA